MSRNEAEEAVPVVFFISIAFGLINRMLSEKPVCGYNNIFDINKRQTLVCLFVEHSHKITVCESHRVWII